MAALKQEISQLATLGRLNLTDEEEKKFAGDLQEILEFAEKINEVDTENIQPTYHALPLENVFRDDVCQPGPPIETVLKQAPASIDGYFSVPRVIDRE